MQEKQVPSICGVVGWSSCEDGKEVVLKGANSLFGSVSAVDMGGHQLQFTVIGHNGALEGSTGFVVHDMHGRCIAGSCNACIDVLVH